jgi:hypothetical protein
MFAIPRKPALIAAIRPTLVLCTAITLAACGKPLPADKAAYAGLWQSPEMSLLITPDGSVKYERLEGGATKSVSGPLQGFEGPNFSVGIGPMSTTFVVAAAPQTQGDKTTMTVDGVVLTRQDD